MTIRKIATVTVLSVVLCLTASASVISGESPPSIGTTFAVNTEAVCEGFSVSGTDYTHRWIDAIDGNSDAQQIRAAGQIRYLEENNAIYGTTNYVKTFVANTGNEPHLDADKSITFVADPEGGKLVSNEEVGLLVVIIDSDDLSGTPSEADLSSLCPWKEDADVADEISALNEAVAAGSDMNVSIVRANTAATVGVTDSERNLSYVIVAAGPQETGGYGAGRISAEMAVVVQEGTIPATSSTSPSLDEYQEFKDSVTSSGVWIFSKVMDYISE